MTISNFAALSVTINGGISINSGQPAHAAFDQFIAFGDSVIDSGYFLTHPITTNASKEALYQQAAAAGGGRPTDPNNPMNSELIAQGFGLSAIPVGMPGGTNYAASGATVTGSLTGGFLAPSITSQVNTYLSSTNGVADPNALYYFSGGGNDLKNANNMSSNAAAQSYMISEADSMAASIVQLKNAGAQYFVLNDLNGENTSSLSVAYNNELWGDLTSAGIQFIVADDSRLVRRITNNPQAFGITNTTKPPVGPFDASNPYNPSNGGSVINPSPASLSSAWSLFGTQDVSANAATTYLWADNEHLAEAGQAAEATYTLSAIQHAAPVISETLNATITDPFTSNSAANTTFQWQRLAAGQTSWSDISGANSSSYTVQSADAGSEIRVEAFYSDAGGNTANAVSPATYAVVSPTPVVGGPAAGALSDFNGDGVSDVLFRNNSTGDYGFEALTAAGGETWHFLGSSDPSYVAIGSGDYNGDGVSDVLFRNNSTGDYGFEALTAAGGETWHSLGSSNPSYRVVGTGDFNGDGVSDVLFRNNSTGDYGFEALTAAGGETWHPLGSSDPSYAVVGTGDFNGDGVSDVLFRNNSTGDYGFEALTAAGGETWHPLGSSDPSYAVVGTGDFNGDSVSDVLFRNNSTGDYGFEALTAAGGETWHPLGSSDPSYGVARTGNFNGSGATDVLFRSNSNGNYGFEALTAGGGQTWQPLGGSDITYNVV